MLKHFPFGEAFEAGMGGRALKALEPLCDLDEVRYRQELALKRQLLAQQHDAYCFSGADALGERWQVVEWEVLQLVLEDLAQKHPSHFGLQCSGAHWVWDNRLLAERHELTFGDSQSLAGLSPLDWVGRQVQEDLVLVSADPKATFVGGQLCFPNAWDIADKLGQSFAAVHAPTAASTLEAVNAGQRLVNALKPGRTYCRLGWHFKLTDQLDLSTKHMPAYQRHVAERAPQLDAESVGRELYLRVERQTLTRLRRSEFILFGIHTYCSPLELETSDPERARRMLQVLLQTPDDVRRYKALDQYEHALLPHLRAKANAT